MIKSQSSQNSCANNNNNNNDIFVSSLEGGSDMIEDDASTAVKLQVNGYF